MILPNFLIIGAAKCGTTSLYNYLVQHPNIVPAVHKEIHFFDLNYHKGISWYLSHFPLLLNPKPDMITGEASPYYMFHPHAAQRIYETMPQAKIIAILRNPVERAYSHYHYFSTNTLSFEKALEIEQSKLNEEKDRMMKDKNYNSDIYQQFSILSRGIYVDQLLVFERYFGKDQMLLIKTEDLYRNPQRVVNRVFDFLHVPQYNINHFVHYNRNSYKPMDASIRKYLAEYYKPHNQRLYQYVGEDLGWD